ncbi:MAG: hypothetical protein LC791_09535 [Acidobacteria bacterium]|nr:hypothetical protein [Acidobacteriota bacterium]
MARALGLNPRKLTGLRPSPKERRRLPVGDFIEECFGKRFGSDQHARQPKPPSRTPSTTTLDADVAERVRDPARQLSDLACYLVNLANDLQQWLAHGAIDPDVLPQVREELQEIVKALDTGESISPIPAIPPPPPPRRRGLSRRRNEEHAFDEEEIPF